MRLVDVDELGVGRCSKDVLPAVYCAGWNGLLSLIEKAPTVDAVPVVHGKWERVANRIGPLISTTNAVFVVGGTLGMRFAMMVAINRGIA